MSETNTPTTAPESPPQEQENLEVIEIPWETARETFEVRKELWQTQKYLADFLLNHERKKRELLQRIEALESAMYESASLIQETHPVNPEWTYEFKLPAREGEKAYFIRKEEQN